MVRNKYDKIKNFKKYFAISLNIYDPIKILYIAQNKTLT